eukprot:TRINITY_DN16245_c0_g1_i1.p1 TRINITY_DN16245_c0_g1~~TRINITY_DN16245_c0_g1_i1.p1  ORF type:complete len:322 (-),score=22.85 TRINITY_DN16245_c0_g1_i1:105-1070(-)
MEAPYVGVGDEDPASYAGAAWCFLRLPPLLGVALGLSLAAVLHLMCLTIGPTTDAVELGHGGVMSLSAQEYSVDSCFGSGVHTQQPFYVAVLAAYTKMCITDIAIPPRVTTAKIKRSSYVVNFVLLAIAALTLCMDCWRVHHLPNCCTHIVWTGSSNVLLIFQVCLRWAGLIRHDREHLDPGHYTILKCWIVIMIPYLCAEFLSFVVVVLPACFIYCPIFVGIILMVLVPMLCFVFAMGCFFDRPSRGLDGDISFVLAVQAVLPAIAVIFKFMGEIGVRFYEGEGWWASVYHTWSERTLSAYGANMFLSFEARLSTLSSFI